jgi:hypothetical protein
MKELRLPLKKQWFDLTKDGIKTEDYREIAPYWCRRFFIGKFSEPIGDFCEFLKISCDANGFLRLYGKRFTTNTMTLGYPKSNDTERKIKFEHLGITINYGREEWGAEPGKLYFVIKHGRRL